MAASKLDKLAKAQGSVTSDLRLRDFSAFSCPFSAKARRAIAISAAHHAHEAARAQRRRRADARRSRRLTRPASSRSSAVRRSTPGATASAGCSIASSGCSAAGSVYVELQRHFRRDEEADNQALVALAAAFRVPIVATNGVRFAAPAERPLFDVLTCIHHHTDARAGGPAARAERRALSEVAAGDGGALRRSARVRSAGPRELADRLQYTMADLGYRFPDYPVPPGETQASFLRKITDVGARDRYRPYHDRARAQIARELDLIEKLNLAGYFLIVWDIVNFCRQHDILVQGRGVGGQQRRLLQPRHHGRRSGRDGSAVRAVSVGRARRVARHRSGSAERRSPRAGHSARLRKVRPARRRDDRQRHHVSRPERGARSGQGARVRRRRRSIGSRR